MTVTRRAALRRAAALGAALAVPSEVVGAHRAQATGRRVPLYALTTWRTLVGTRMDVAGQPGSALRVAAVRDRAHSTRRNRMPGRGDVFTIRFTGHSGPPLDEGIHTLNAPGLGPLGLFLSPTGPKPDYLALVNTWLPTKGSGKAVDGGPVPR
ncbi:hypothetical protein SRB5_00880 [Streptomyces sp. RB5]|uniref:DUF6916 domain-containing protein n=1 Tax=Streptomyces smaragdinus TaxID=2585196 RepID=A0A7K0CB28_9ACTN|nr:hypothetical protein [Streptomyces smaragdinus]MQY09984.1 hypothetical protein [Streptomyces smaragdinus]